MNYNVDKLVLVAILAVLLLTLSMSAASAQTVTIADGSADAGATTTVTVTADGVTDLANFDITVTYNPAVVNVTGAENALVFGGNNNLEGASTGTVRLMSFNTGSGQTGDGILLSTLTLKALGTASQTSALTLTVNELTNSTEGAITATVDNGVFTVNATTADTTDPTITSVTLNTTSVGPGGSVTVTVVATDASGIASVTANGTTGTVTLAYQSGDIWQGTITAPSTAGPYTVTVVATDASTNANTKTDTSKSFMVGENPCTITLSTTGYTLISMPLNDLGIATASDLADRITGCTEVVRYDETTGAFVSYVPGNPLNDFAIVKGRGYFVNGATVSSVTFYGDIWE